ncbi:hypothetical protein M3P05_06285 [Sansalvadorimonas sp. 2012CJ34-2]|uniref:Flagellar basal body rod protein FlgB n=1 Tax=Parendozoicomonas callyspongiae TaxID=2942213 RepID=A0ABT0PGB5_9GAMM|nr:hypothetical protein [Sansalvadorimonas sp. 2012CJ34-2]MCL6269548.1 hypothetical protein [Sansalvadorimonas sp. 2012CJ34-2]
MAISFAEALGYHPELLSLQAEKVTVYGSNLVNSETPNYQASDFDITLREQVLAMTRTDERHLTPSPKGAVVTRRSELQTMLNGNSVDVPLEQATIAHTLSDYSTNMSFIRYHLTALSAAINGR